MTRCCAPVRVKGKDFKNFSVMVLALEPSNTGACQALVLFLLVFKLSLTMQVEVLDALVQEVVLAVLFAGEG